MCFASVAVWLCVDAELSSHPCRSPAQYHLSPTCTYLSVSVLTVTLMSHGTASPCTLARRDFADATAPLDRVSARFCRSLPPPLAPWPVPQPVLPPPALPPRCPPASSRSSPPSAVRGRDSRRSSLARSSACDGPRDERGNGGGSVIATFRVTGRTSAAASAGGDGDGGCGTAFAAFAAPAALTPRGAVATATTPVDDEPDAVLPALPPWAVVVGPVGPVPRQAGTSAWDSGVAVSRLDCSLPSPGPPLFTGRAATRLGASLNPERPDPPVTRAGTPPLLCRRPVAPPVARCRCREPPAGGGSCTLGVGGGVTAPTPSPRPRPRTRPRPWSSP